MVESTTDTPASTTHPSTQASGIAGAPQAEAAAAPEASLPAEVSIRALLEAGVHFGHQTRRWNPRMGPYIFGERNGIHIIDLDRTLPLFQAALDFLREVAAQGGKVLFVGTKRQAQASVESEARRCQQFYVNNRWLGGALTNFKTVKKSIERYLALEETIQDEEKAASYTKRERARLQRELGKYQRSLEGLKHMTRLPDAVFILDVNREHIAVREAQRLGIPIVAIVDSNSNPDGIDYVIPGNDDALRAVHLYCRCVADACLEGAEIFNERVQSEASEREARPAEPAAAQPARRVVEITHPPRRGRAARGAGGRPGDLEDAAAPAPSAAAEAPSPEAPTAEAAPSPASKPAAPARRKAASRKPAPEAAASGQAEAGADDAKPSEGAEERSASDS
ncbi:MAG: 30S ribosomal protein S2 [Deltaproteobacteria bacterium]|nr:MAG: 30S ribosomal protein S2 [Deltaproteobacteria bacterium]